MGNQEEECSRQRDGECERPGLGCSGKRREATVAGAHHLGGRCVARGDEEK